MSKYQNSTKYKIDAKKRVEKYKKSGQRKQISTKYYNTLKGRLKCYLGVLRRRERLKHLTSSYTKEEWATKLKDTQGFCQVCNKFIGIEKLTMDHTPPISKAPINFNYTIDNITPLCKSCNCSKGNG